MKSLFVTFLLIIISTMCWGTIWRGQYAEALDYENSDLVVHCSINRIDTILLSHFDSLHIDGELEEYDIIIESYILNIDSILKNTKPKRSIELSICSDTLKLNYNKGKISKTFSHIDGEKDSVFYFESSFSVISGLNKNRFRLDNNYEYVLLFEQKSKGYRLIWRYRYSKSRIDFFKSVEENGADYYKIKIEGKNKKRRP